MIMQSQTSEIASLEVEPEQNEIGNLPKKSQGLTLQTYYPLVRRHHSVTMNFYLTFMLINSQPEVNTEAIVTK